MRRVFFYIIAAILITGCKKDKPYTYSYDGLHFEVVWAGYYYDDILNGYCFGISPVIPTGSLFYEAFFFEVDYPESLLGQKLDLSVAYNDSDWELYGYFQNGGKRYYFEEGDDGTGDLSGSNNWVMVTKNSSDNFTLEFSMTIGGKLLEGKYSGKFQKKEYYLDVGAIPSYF